MGPAIVVSIIALIVAMVALGGLFALWYSRSQKVYTLPDTVAFNAQQPRNSPRNPRISVVNGDVAKWIDFVLFVFVFYVVICHLYIFYLI